MCKFLSIIGLVLFSLSCRKDNIVQNEPIRSSYIIAGHAYGKPGTTQYRLYDKLVSQFGIIKQMINPVKYIFTGDLVVKGTEENWTNVLFQLDSLGLEYWIAPGNHDISTNYFVENVQNKLFFSERIENNLFLILNTNFAGWTIGQDQVSMVELELSNLQNIRNIFVFSHQVWWADDSLAPFDLEKVYTNSGYLSEGPQSFWEDVFPLFNDVSLPTYFFAGDVGAFTWVPSYKFEKVDNFHFYASGMGSGKEDNVLHLKTFDSGKVEVGRIHF